MIDAGISELKHSFFEHGKVAKGGNSPSHYLLLFYAVECGLKMCVLKSRFKKKISELKEEDITTHKLADFCKKLKWKIDSISFRLENGSSLPIEYAHQAWRYGVKIQKNDEEKVVEWLKNLQEKIKCEI